MKRLTLAGIVLAMCAACTLPARAQVPGLMVFEYNSYKHITTSTTTTLTNPHIFASICVNTAGATGATITIYDNTAASGTIIAVIDATMLGCYYYDAALSTGLTIVTATGTPGDYTVAYR